jgi:hypothetical protein
MVGQHAAGSRGSIRVVAGEHNMVLSPARDSLSLGV